MGDVGFFDRKTGGFVKIMDAFTDTRGILRIPATKHSKHITVRKPLSLTWKSRQKRNKKVVWDNNEK